MKKRRLFVIPVVLVLIGGAMLFLQFGCGFRPGSGENPPGRGGSARPERPGPGGFPSSAREETVFPVRVATAEQGRMESSIKINGDVVAGTRVQVFPDIAGKVSGVPVRIGDYVRKGETVVLVDPSKPGGKYVESPVESTISGTVMDIFVEKGQSVTQAVPVAEIGNLRNLEVETRVPERFASSVRIGGKAELAFESFPDKRFSARVVQVSPALDAVSRTLEVTLGFEDPERIVKAGMFAEVRLVTGVRDNAVHVPSGCVVSRGGSEVVFVVDESGRPAAKASAAGDQRSDSAPETKGGQSKAVQRAVKIGILVDGRVEILEGLERGETVVVQGQTLLEDGVQVRVTEPPAVDDAREGGGA